jgi:hypothetical protein
MRKNQVRKEGGGVSMYEMELSNRCKRYSARKKKKEIKPSTI